MPSVIFSFVLMTTSPFARIDRIVHPDYNYTQANQKFKYWLKRQVLSLEKAND
nr:MAG TPA: hypothetical protein [Caudoviricetes sp.]